MNHEEIIQQLTKQLSVAMDKRPSDNAINVIHEALDLVYPSRKKVLYTHLNHETTIENWDVSNSDIIKALERFNQTY